MGFFSDLEKQLTPEALAGSAATKASWLSGYLQASFRGVEFLIQSAENGGGRRIQSHQFPGRDDIYHEDLGRAERTYRFSAYIVADNYFQQREDLIEALEKKGPGKLVHPYRGIFQVVVKSWTATESTNEGRMVRFEIEMSEQKVVELTVATKNTKSETAAKKADLIDSLNAEFIAAYNIGQMAVTGVQDTLKEIDRALDVILNAKKVVSTAADFQRELSNVKGKLVQFAFDAKDLANALTGLVNFGTDSLATAENSVEQLREMNAVYSLMSINTSNTPDDIFYAPGYAAAQVQILTAQAAVAGAVGLTSKIAYETVEQAKEVQQGIFDLLDQVQQNPNTPDTIYEATRAAKAAVVEDMEATILNLARLVDYTLFETSNTLEISNTIYGDVTNEQEIINRNSILHPMFVSAAKPLKVVSNG